MKRLKKCAASLCVALSVSAVMAPQSSAAAIPMTSESAAAPRTIAELRMQVGEPDLSRGRLVSEVWGTEEDGTPYVERIYVKELRSETSYSNIRDYGSYGSVDVWATFDYDPVAKKVGIMSSGGRYNDTGSITDYDDGKITNKGSNTTKATATYSRKVYQILGSKTVSVSISCDYLGNPS